MIDFLSSLFRESSFLGALLGATITGGLALYINSFQHKKQEQKEVYESKKVLTILHHYSKVMIIRFNDLTEDYNKYEAVYDPHSEIDFYIDDDGNEHIAYFPPEFEIKAYKHQVQPFIDIIKRESEFILDEFEKVNAVNIYALKLKELDKTLRFLSFFRTFIEPKLRNMIKSEYPNITLQERDTIGRIFEAFHNATKIN